MSFLTALTLRLTDVPPSAVPQAAEFLDAQPLSKGKTEKTKKKKNQKERRITMAIITMKKKKETQTNT